MVFLVPDEREDKRFLLAAVALHGMCVGGTVLADLLAEEITDQDHEARAKSAQEISKSCVLLADSVLEILDGTERSHP